MTYVPSQVVGHIRWGLIQSDPSQYHQENFWHLIAQYFRLLYYVWSIDRLIDAISSFHQTHDFQYFFEVALGRYWKEPITHLAILAQPPPHWITCSLTVKTNWYCSFRRMSITFVWHRKVYGPVLHWTEGTEWIFHNWWKNFDAATSLQKLGPSKT